ncbi:helix-turn-helix domain-containing protein [Lentzea sp. CA-135723]|uniref:PucR family transcriptional regulator n=1 Tax=Lentzea sp. CA-135723 TaxID=3239950 RepID=UPI003D8F2F10
MTTNWLHRLTGDPALAPASSADALAGAAERLGAGPVAWSVETGRRLADVIAAEVPDLAASADLLATLRMGTESVVLRAVLLLAGDPAAGAPEEALLGDREFARRRIGLGQVLRGIRVSHAELNRLLMSACADLAPAASHAAEFRRISELLLGYVEEFSSTMTAEYLAEHDRWVVSGAAAREEAVRQVLAGGPPDRALGYSLQGRHLAVVVWSEEDADLQHAAARFLRQAGCQATLVVPTGRASLWAWGTLVGGPAGVGDGLVGGPAGVRGGLVGGQAGVRGGLGGEPAGVRGGLVGGQAGVRSGLAGEPAGVRGGLVGGQASVRGGSGGEPAGVRGGLPGERAGAPPGVRIACGAAHPGPDGFRRSHREAEAAARLMRLNPAQPPVVHHRDVALACLLAADVEGTRRFVRAELGELAADTENAARLRETLRHYLREERSLATTAARLHIARNTVTYRVKRAQELLGHDVGDRLPEVLAALEAAHAFGRVALHDDLP